MSQLIVVKIRRFARLAGSHFPDQGLNLGHGSENPEF